jgi:hypothetical protein
VRISLWQINPEFKFSCSVWTVWRTGDFGGPVVEVFVGDWVGRACFRRIILEVFYLAGYATESHFGSRRAWKDTVVDTRVFSNSFLYAKYLNQQSSREQHTPLQPRCKG